VLIDRPRPGHGACAEGKNIEGEGRNETRAAIFIGPGFGTLSPQDQVVATREAEDADFEVLPPDHAPKGADLKHANFISVKVNGFDVFPPDPRGPQRRNRWAFAPHPKKQ